MKTALFAPRSILTFCSVALFSLLTLAAAEASVLFSYDAASSTPNPTSQGWSPSQGDNSTLSATSGTHGQTPVWTVTSGSGGTGTGYSLYYYKQFGSIDPTEIAKGWSFSTKVAVDIKASSSGSYSSILLYTRHKADGTTLTGNARWSYAAYFGATEDKKLTISLAGYNSQAIVYTAVDDQLVNVELRYVPGSPASHFL